MAVDLTEFRAFIGAVSVSDDEGLKQSLDAARAHIFTYIYTDAQDELAVDEAVLLLASRLWKRRQSPEGTAGFGGDGVVVRILARDPDIDKLLERYQDMTNIGIG